jgi:hypothetical protein
MGEKRGKRKKKRRWKEGREGIISIEEALSRRRRGADEIHRRDGYDNPVGEKQLMIVDWCC